MDTLPFETDASDRDRDAGLATARSLPAEMPDPLLGRIDRLMEALDPGDGNPLSRYYEPKGTYQIHPLGVEKTPRGDIRHEKVPESIVWDPRAQAVPIVMPSGGTAQLTALNLEDRLWNSGSWANTVVGLGSVNLLEAMRIAVRLYNTAPLAKRIINAYTYLTIGEGVEITFNTRASSGRTIRAKWERIRRATRFDAKVKHLVRMTFLCGEAFTALDPISRSGKKVTKTGFHYIEPDRVPRIFTSSEDIDDVQKYELLNVENSTSLLNPDDVVHSRVNRIGNVPRGIPIMLPSMRNIREWDLFVENRAWINRTRARYPMNIEVDGGTPQISAAKAFWTGLPQPGTVTILPKGQRINFPPHNIGASDVKDDRMLLAETIAAGVDLPVFVVLPTASDANYSASVVAESPMVRMFLEMQELFRFDIERIVSALTGQDPDAFHVEFPPVLRRGLGELAGALGVAVQNGFMSRQTAWERIRTGDRPWSGEGGEAERIADEESRGLFGNMFDAPSPIQKKADGGVGSPPEGTSPGAAARGEPGPSVDGGPPASPTTSGRGERA